jgi:hypothetical protein
MPEHEPIRVGDIGRAVSELKPMGEIEVGMLTVEASSHSGVIDRGTTVEVLDYKDGVATVRAKARGASASDSRSTSTSTSTSAPTSTSSSTTEASACT